MVTCRSCSIALAALTWPGGIPSNMSPPATGAVVLQPGRQISYDWGSQKPVLSLKQGELHFGITLFKDCRGLMTSRSHILESARQEVYTACMQKFSNIGEGDDLQRPTAPQLDCPSALLQYWLALHQHNQHPLPPHQQAGLRGELPTPQPAEVPAISTRPYSAVQH